MNSRRSIFFCYQGNLDFRFFLIRVSTTDHLLLRCACATDRNKNDDNCGSFAVCESQIFEIIFSLLSMAISANPWGNLDFITFFFAEVNTILQRFRSLLWKALRSSILKKSSPSLMGTFCRWRIEYFSLSFNWSWYSQKSLINNLDAFHIYTRCLIIRVAGDNAKIM